MSKKQITIIIPLFNRASLILETLQSIQAQTNKDWKCIVVDDGSTDKSCQVVNKLAENDTRIKLIKRDRGPKGANTCRNIGLDIASTEWVMFFDSDDLMLPWCIEKRINAIENNQHVDILLSQGATFTEHDIIGFRNNPKANDYLQEILRFNISLSTPCALWKRGKIKEINGWNEKFQRWQDPELFIRAFSSKLRHKWVHEYPDHIIRVEDDKSKITNSQTAYKSFESFIENLCIVYRDLSSDLRFVFENSVYFYCLRASYFINKKQSKKILNVLSKNSFFATFRKIKFRLLMSFNVKLKNVKFVKGIIHKLIEFEIKKYTPKKSYTDNELLGEFRARINEMNYLKN